LVTLVVVSGVFHQNCQLEFYSAFKSKTKTSSSTFLIASGVGRAGNSFVEVEAGGFSLTAVRDVACSAAFHIKSDVDYKERQFTYLSIALVNIA
jgi:hypothetical protein